MKFLLITLLLFFASCKNNPPENKEALAKALNEFTFYRKDSIFSTYIFGGVIPKYANEYLEDSKRVRKDLGLKDISNGIPTGFQFGFHFEFNGYISYYLHLSNDEHRISAKLYKSRFEQIGSQYNKVFAYSTPVYKRIFFDSFTVKPKLGWTNLFSELFLLKAHKVLNENDPSIVGHSTNVAGMIPYVYFEFVNKNYFTISSWMAFNDNLNFEQSILVNKIITLLYKEFNLKKYMDKNYWL